MIRAYCSVLALAVAGFSASPTQAQSPAKPARPKPSPAKPAKPARPASKAHDPYAPVVVGMVTNANELLRDIDAAMGLTDPADQKQQPELIKYLDVFLTGVDRTRPARIDMIFSEDTYRYRSSFPVLPDQINNFRKNNLDPLGIESRVKFGSYWGLSNAFEGFMRYKDEYMSIAEREVDIPRTMPDPTVDIAPLVEKKYHAAIDARNVNDGQVDRRRNVEKANKDAIVALKRREDEAADDFAIRRAWTEWRHNEYGRIYVEASRFLLGGTIDPSAKSIDFDVDVVPIAGTPLEASIDATEKHVSRFAVVERGERPVLSLRMSYPLDEGCAAHLTRVMGLYRTSSLEDIANSTERSPEEKAQTKLAADKFYDLVDSIIRLGRLDGFIEGHTNPSGKHTLVGAGVIPEGADVLAILQILPMTGKGNTVELNIDEVAGVTLHRATAPSGFRSDFKEFFGTETIVVGTSKDVLWLACGDNALEGMKAAIQRVAGGGDAAARAPRVLIDGIARLGPLVKAWDHHSGKDGDPRFRQRAIGAFKPGDDELVVDLKPVEGRVTGTIAGRAGVMRFIGAQLAEFTRNIDK